MQNTPNRDSKSQALMTMTMVWGALLASTLFYFVILNQQTPPTELPAENDGFKLVFPLVAFLEVIMAIFLPKFLWEAQKVPFAEPINISEVATRWYTPFILRMALFESVAVLGFAWATLSKVNQHYYLFWMVAVAGMVWSFPKADKLKEQAKALNQKLGHRKS